MFSIIVCSIDPQAAERLRENIAGTIGVPYEFLAFDNRTAGRGICAVYNDCARRAKYDLLCFVHEDVAFRTQDWGGTVASKLSEADCGVVGFAGGRIKTREITGWSLDERDARRNYFRPLGHGTKLEHCYDNTQDEEYAPIVCLDGLCLMTRRSVWERAPFDEQLLTGFHAYDLDFTTSAACGYRNYVCNVIDIEHRSFGSYSLDWIHWLRIYHEKWHDRLPLFAGPRPSDGRIAALERRAGQLLILKLMRLRLYSRKQNLRMVARFVCHNPLWSGSWLLIYKFFRNGLRAPKN